jgi:hypothetical protein
MKGKKQREKPGVVISEVHENGPYRLKYLFFERRWDRRAR